MNTWAYWLGNGFRNSCGRTGRGPGDPHAARPSLERSRLSLRAEVGGPCARRGTLLCCPPSASYERTTSPSRPPRGILFLKRKVPTNSLSIRVVPDGLPPNPVVRVPRRAQRPRRQGLLRDQTRSSAPPVFHLCGRCGHFGACTGRARAPSLCLMLFPLCVGASGILCCPATSSARGRGAWSCNGQFPYAWLCGSCLWQREPCPPARRIACGARESSTRTRVSLIRNKRPRADALECVTSRVSDRWLVQHSDAVRTATAADFSLVGRMPGRDKEEPNSRGCLFKLEVTNFKSYAGMLSIGPFKDFTCVIGPNGSGLCPACSAGDCKGLCCARSPASVYAPAALVLACDQQAA